MQIADVSGIASITAPFDQSTVAARRIGRHQPVVARLHRVRRRPVGDRDRPQPFRASDPGEARHHGAEREAVLREQRHIIHRPSDQHVRRRGLRGRDRHLERRVAACGAIDQAASGALDRVGRREPDMRVRAEFGAGRVEQFGKRRAGPDRVADRAGRPRIAAGRRDRLQAAPAVAGALQHRLDAARREAGAELLHREVERPGDAARHAQPVGGRVERRHRAVTAHVEQRRPA